MAVSLMQSVHNFHDFARKMNLPSFNQLLVQIDSEEFVSHLSPIKGYWNSSSPIAGQSASKCSSLTSSPTSPQHDEASNILDHVVIDRLTSVSNSSGTPSDREHYPTSRSPTAIYDLLNPINDGGCTSETHLGHSTDIKVTQVSSTRTSINGLTDLRTDVNDCEQGRIDSNKFNPRWGATRAGRPRKRLGEACVGCRARKIKCDPSVPKCFQCQKSDRECKYASKSRASLKNNISHSPKSTLKAKSVKIHGKLPSKGQDSTKEKDITILDQLEHSSTSKIVGTLVENHSPSSPVLRKRSPSEDPETDKVSTKKCRYQVDCQPPLNPNANEYSNSTDDHSVSNSLPLFHWDKDPYEVDPTLTLHYLGLFFVEVNNPSFRLLPHRMFINWVQKCRDKSKWDKMLLYSLMALGSTFLPSHAKIVHQHNFVEIVEDAANQSQGIFNLQVVQSRLSIARLHLAIGNGNQIWDAIGSATRAAVAMGLYNEETVADVNEADHVYWLDHAMVAECRRRTFWTAYMMNQFPSVSSFYVSPTQFVDYILRNPCSEVMYEKGEIPTVPKLNSVESKPRSTVNEDYTCLGGMAFMIELSTILNAIIIRAAPAKVGKDNTIEYETFFEATTYRLQTCDIAIRTHFQIYPVSQDILTAGMCMEGISGLRVLHHFCAITLHRYLPQEAVNSTSQTRSIRGVYRYSFKLLELVRRLINDDKNGPQRFKVSTTSFYTAFAILHAIDVISAAGMLNTFLNPQNASMNLLFAGIEALDLLADHWAVAKDIRTAAKARVSLLLSLGKMGTSKLKKAFFIRESLVPVYGKVQDTVYGVSRVQYLQTLGWGDNIREDELFELEPTDPSLGLHNYEAFS